MKSNICYDDKYINEFIILGMEREKRAVFDVFMGSDERWNAFPR